MPSATDLLNWIAVEEEERRRHREAVERPKWDWYGPDCGCPPEGRKKDGSCREHPRARANQRPPDDIPPLFANWQIWYLEAGRAFGKTLTGARWVQHLVETRQARRFALVAPTAADVRDVMVGGETGVIEASSPWCRAVHQPSKSRIIWHEPDGKKVRAIANLYSADEPDRLRGQNSEKAWVDELAAWRRPEAFDMLMFGLRIGKNPQCLVTTTPKPHPWLRAIKKKLGTVVVRASTYENRANLAESYFSTIIKKYEGTRLGRQELLAEDLEDTPGALWTTEVLEANRVDLKDIPELARVVVAIDPSVADPNADPDHDTAECGIVVGGMCYQSHPTLEEVPFGYVLEDCSLKAHPHVWAKAAVDAYHRHQADMIVAEVNNGGAMVATVINSIDPTVPVKCLHASRGKHTRAEPIASFYQQGRVKHSKAADLSKLEDQMTSWVPGLKSPDRMDANVWLMTELLTEGMPLTVGPDPFEGYRG